MALTVLLGNDIPRFPGVCRFILTALCCTGKDPGQGLGGRTSLPERVARGWVGRGSIWEVGGQLLNWRQSQACLGDSPAFPPCTELRDGSLAEVQKDRATHVRLSERFLIALSRPVSWPHSPFAAVCCRLSGGFQTSDPSSVRNAGYVTARTFAYKTT